LGALAVFVQWQLALPLDMSRHGLGPSAYSFLIALNCGVIVLLQPILAARLHRYDAARALAVSAALLGAGYGVNALGGTLAVYLAGTLCWTFGEMIGLPVASAMVADLAPTALRGRYQGAYSMCWGIALILSPLAAGETMQRFGARTLWLACLAVALVVAAGHLATGGSRRRRIAQVLHAHHREPAVAVSG
jgi:MFS family permease